MAAETSGGNELYAYDADIAQRSTLPNTLIVKFLRGVQEQIVRDNVLYETVSKRKDGKIRAKYLQFYVGVEEGGGFIAGNEDVTAREPETIDGQLATVTSSGYQLISGGISIPMELAAKDPDAVYYNVAADRVKKMTEKANWHIGREFIGDGSCTLCRIKTVAGDGVTCTVDTDAFPRTTRHLKRADSVTAWPGLSAVSARDSEKYTLVSQLTSDTGFVLRDALVGLVATDYLAFNNNRDRVGLTDYFFEITGLRKVASESESYLGINPASADCEMWKGIEYMNGGTKRPHDMNYLWATASRQQRQLKASPDLCLAALEMQVPFNEATTATLQTTNAEQGKVTKGQPGLTIPNANGKGTTTITLTISDAMPPGDYHLVVTKFMHLLTEVDLEFLDKELMRRVPRKLKKEGEMCFAGQLFFTHRQACSLVGDFSYDLIPEVR